VHTRIVSTPPAHPEQLRFSTATLPAGEGLSAWRTVFGRTMVQVEVEPLRPEAFHSDMIVCRSPDLGVLLGAADAMRLKHAGDVMVNNDLLFITSHTPQWSVARLNRCHALGPGDGILMSNAAVWSMMLSSPASFTTLRVPRATIAALLPNPGNAITHIVRADNVALRLLERYLANALDTEALVAPALRELAICHVRDLLALAFAACFEAADPATGRGLRAARLRAIKSDILAHLGNRELSLQAVATRQAISSIYIRKLFESEDTSFTQFVLRERLARSHRRLSDPRFAGRTIAALALEAGFGDLSYFNRAFRRRYGIAPSAVRAVAHGENNGKKTLQRLFRPDAKTWPADSRSFESLKQMRIPS
jgi:AraC-like DNA-binding protein